MIAMRMNLRRRIVWFFIYCFISRYFYREIFLFHTIRFLCHGDFKMFYVCNVRYFDIF